MPLLAEPTRLKVVEVTPAMSQVPFAAVFPSTPLMTTDWPFTNECAALVVIWIGVLTAPVMVAVRSCVEEMVVPSNAKSPPPPSAMRVIPAGDGDVASAERSGQALQRGNGV